MHDAMPPAPGAVRWKTVVDRPDDRRCPHCGSGDLFEIRLRRGAGVEKRAAYCAGLYDRDRRRIVSRSCGYLEGEGEGAIVAPS